MPKQNDKMSTQEAMALFDRLAPATEDQMIGKWRGEGIDTEHAMDGMLESSYWYGKVFDGPEAVYPLIHKVPGWGRVAVNPALLPIGLSTRLPFRDWIAPVLFPMLVPLIRTTKPRARLRSIQFRGRMHAAMAYDAKPINDVFVVLSSDTMLGWMDFKGMEQPYFFKLQREA